MLKYAILLKDLQYFALIQTNMMADKALLYYIIIQALDKILKNWHPYIDV